MVVQGLIALALAAPTGGLFGLAYGTAIRVGYEIIYPLLFDKIAKDISENKDTGEATLSKQTEIVIGKMNSLYTGIGGLEANAFGINTGIKNAMQSINDDPELMELLKKNSNLLSQNITVNLSGTGLIDEEGRVVSAPPDLALSEIEKLEATVIIDANRRNQDDAVCKKAFGQAYVAAYDSDKQPISCLIIKGGVVSDRRGYPGAANVPEKTIETPQDRFKIAQAKALKQVEEMALTGSEKLHFLQFKNTLPIPNPNKRNTPKWHGINLQNTRNSRLNTVSRQWIARNSKWGRYGVWLKLSG